MDQIYLTTMIRAAELLAEAAERLQEAAREAGAGHRNMARGGAEYALASTRRAQALIEACHTLQGEIQAA